MKMQTRLFLTGFGLTAAILATIPMGDKPAIARLVDAGTEIAQNVLQQPKLVLNLEAHQKQIQKNATGKETINWKALDSNITVKPGDVIRFTVNGKNEGNRVAKSLVITQPVARGLVYQLNSATPVNNANLTYSIDSGKTFVENPVVKVTLANGKVEERPAPAEAYTHVRWSFNQQMQPNASVQIAYLTKVR